MDISAIFNIVTTLVVGIVLIFLFKSKKNTSSGTDSDLLKIQILEEKNIEYSNHIAVAKDKIEQLDRGKHDLETKNQSRENEISNLKESNIKLEQQIHSLTKENSDLKTIQGKYEEILPTYGKLQADNRSLDERIQVLTKENADLKTIQGKYEEILPTYGKLQADNRSLDERTQVLTKDNATLKKLEGQQEELKDTNNKLLLEKSSLTEQVKNLNEKNEILKKLEGQQEELVSSNSKLRQEIASLTEQVKNLNDKNEVAIQNSKKQEVEINNLKNSLSKKEQEVSDHIQKLSQSERTLEDEKQRLRREDEERQKQEEENRSRIWNEHEQSSLKSMKQVCDKQGLDLPYYDNDNLPSDFGSKFKPDFLVKVLEQYIIFDAKLSKSDNINTYLKGQADTTGKKIKENKKEDLIFKSVFFVVPTIDIHKVTKFSYYEHGFTFYVISIEAFEPLITNLKKIEEYKIADDITPQDREGIIAVLASLAYHINYQNAHNYALTKRGMKVVDDMKTLKDDIYDKTLLKLKDHRFENVKDLKDTLFKLDNSKSKIDNVFLVE